MNLWIIISVAPLIFATGCPRAEEDEDDVDVLGVQNAAVERWPQDGHAWHGKAAVRYG